jgi:hypothetical protein
MKPRKTYSNKPTPQRPVSLINEQVADFLQRGGVIQQIPQGATGEEQMSIRRSAAMITAQKASVAQKQSSFGIVKAAQLLQVSHGWLAKQCDAGKGPPFYLNGEVKQFLRDEVLEWDRNRRDV